MKGVQMLLCLMIVLTLWTSKVTSKSLQAVRTDIPPKLDGYLELIWTKADSVMDFVQLSPNWGKPSTERTIVYLLYDDRNIYVAFKCYDSHPGRMDTRTGQRDEIEGDKVRVIFDTFGDDITGYYFGVNLANIQEDGRISSDGLSEDRAWDGVWSSAVVRTSFGYTVEIKVPFKTLRYKEGLSRWGIDFRRTISRKQEECCWSLQQRDGFRISRMGDLVGIRPPQRGLSLKSLNLEPYPVGLIRLEEGSASPELGLDLSWKPSPAMQLLLTFNPDFAQVEADPYRVNLERYPLYYKEKRPFFVEGAEVFSTPLRLFYSRTIGKGLPSGKRVPINAALKFTGKPGRWTFGAIGAWTEKKEGEPESGYYVVRAKRSFWRNSELGVLVGGKRWEGGFNEVIGVDGAFRKGLPQGQASLSYQIARSSLKGTSADYAGMLILYCQEGPFVIKGYYKNQGSNFDVGQIGFEPMRGTEQAEFSIVYISLKAWGPLKQFYAGWGASGYREYISPYFKMVETGPAFDGTFLNNWRLRVQTSFQRRYEMSRWYNDLFTEAHFNTDPTKALYIGDVGFWYHSKRYNWRRGYSAPQAAFWGGVSCRPDPGLKLNFEGSATVEWRPDGSLEHVSWVWHPTVDWSVTKEIYLRWWNEVNMDTDIHRSNLLLSWNFLSKSWAYLALNQSIGSSGDKVELKDRIFVAKVRWLFSI